MISKKSCVWIFTAILATLYQVECDTQQQPLCQDFNWKCLAPQNWGANCDYYCQWEIVKYRCPRLCGVCVDDGSGSIGNNNVNDRHSNNGVVLEPGEIGNIPLYTASASSMSEFSEGDFTTYDPSKMVDGDTSNDLSSEDSSCFYSGYDSGDWVAISFAEESIVSSVSFLSRSDCCADRSDGMEFYICSENDECNYCGKVEGAALGEWHTVNCTSGYTGTYLNITQGAKKYQICEVAVYGKLSGSGLKIQDIVVPSCARDMGDEYSVMRTDDGYALPLVSSAGACFQSYADDSYAAFHLAEETEIASIRVLSPTADAETPLDGSLVMICGLDGYCTNCDVFTETQDGRWNTMDCGGAVGMMVMIEGNGENKLTICEIEIHGFTTGNAKQIPVMRISAYQESTSYRIMNLIDGDAEAYGTTGQTASAQGGANFFMEFHFDTKYTIKAISLQLQYSWATYWDYTVINVLDGENEPQACTSFTNTLKGYWSTTPCDETAGYSVKFTYDEKTNTNYGNEIVFYGTVVDEQPKNLTLDVPSSGKQYSSYTTYRPRYMLYNADDSSWPVSISSVKYYRSNDKGEDIFARVFLTEQADVTFVKFLYKTTDPAEATRVLVCDRYNNCTACSEPDVDSQWAYVKCPSTDNPSIAIHFTGSDDSEWLELGGIIAYGNYVSEIGNLKRVVANDATAQDTYNYYTVTGMYDGQAMNIPLTSNSYDNMCWAEKTEDANEVSIFWDEPADIASVWLLPRDDEQGMVEHLTVQICDAQQSDCTDCGKFEYHDSMTADNYGWYVLNCEQPITGSSAIITADNDAEDDYDWFYIGEVVFYGAY